MDGNAKIDRLLSELAYFYKGAASFEWLEDQPLPKLFRLKEEAVRIQKIKNKNNGF